MKKIIKRLSATFLSIIIASAMAPISDLTASAAFTTASTITIGGIIEYGSYPQTKVTDSSLITALNSQTLSPDNTAAYGGSKYKQVYFTEYIPSPEWPYANYQDDNGYYINTVYWFKYEPLKWRVLSNTGGEVFLLADSIIESRPYNQADTSVTWESSNLRYWLNNDFYNAAFSAAERTRINTSLVANEDNPMYGTEGGNDTSDKLFLLSYNEVTNPDYGFSADHSNADLARWAMGTDYARCKGLYVNTSEYDLKSSLWWLRTPGRYEDNASLVAPGGIVGRDQNPVVCPEIGVRPALKVNLPDDIYVPGNIIEYGSYPQTEVTDSSLITELNAQPLSPDNTAAYGGDLYKRVYFTEYIPSPEWPYANYQDDNGYYINTVYWFKYEPLKWRVLSNTGGELFLLADSIIESKPYNQVPAEVTWESSNLRYWLNNDFYNAAFSSTERARINTSLVVNEDNPMYGTEGGNNTSDKLFLLSYNEVTNPGYGFSADYSNEGLARQAMGTDYARCKGLYVNPSDSNLKNSFWWLRTPGRYKDDASLVAPGGGVGRDQNPVVCPEMGVRPALKINLSRDIITPVEGSGCVVDKDDNCIYGLATGITTLAGYADVAEGYKTEYIPTSSGFGTGTVVKIKLGTITFESYTIIIFGDVNGDGNIDSIDAGKIVDVQNYMITWDPVTDAALRKAADVNGDGNIDSIDAGLIVDTENYMVFIDQRNGLAIPITEIDGSVTITGMAKYGNTLTADISGIIPISATVKYSWKRGGVTIGTGKTYIISADDIGKSITVTVTGYGAFEGGIRSSSVTPTKADVATPVAPTLLAVTPNSVTLNEVPGQEYKIEGGEWQSSGVFTGLNSTTAYNLYTRAKETDTTFSSSASSALSVTTYEKTISGSVTINGVAQYDETLTANISNVLPATATLIYQWKRDGVTIGSDISHTVTVEDIGKSITFTAMGTGDYIGSVTSAELIPIKKANVSIPAAPTLSGFTSNSITVVAVSGQEYKINNGDWQTSGVFTGLNLATTYDLYTRIAETSTYYASVISPVLNVTTSKATITGTVIISGSTTVGGILNADISGIIPSGATLAYKWKSDGVTVGTSSTYTVLEADVGTSITVTVTGTGNYLGSVTSESKFITA